MCCAKCEKINYFSIYFLFILISFFKCKCLLLSWVSVVGFVMIIIIIIIVIITAIKCIV